MAEVIQVNKKHAKDLSPLAPNTVILKKTGGERKGADSPTGETETVNELKIKVSN